MDSTVFQYIGGTITNAIKAFIGPAAADLTNALQGFVLALVILYIMIMGFAIIMGSVQAPITKFTVQCLKIIFITSFMITASVYGPYVVGGFEALETLLSSALNGAPAGNIYEVIDNTLGEGIALAKICFDNVSAPTFGISVSWLFPAIMITLGTIAIVILGGALIIAAKLMLALLFAIGPFFIVMLIFPITARFFDGWLRQAMNYTFIVVTASVIMSFAMVAFSAFLGAADLSGDGEQNPLLVAVQIFILACVFSYLIYQTTSFAAGLAGGLSMSVLTWAHVVAPARLARNAVDPVSNRRDLQSGMMTTARRHEHLIGGNTPINPAYNQSMRQNIGKNWGRAKGGKVES